MKSSPLFTTIVFAMLLLPGIFASLCGNDTDFNTITIIEDLIEFEDIVVINWTPLNYSHVKHYVLEYKQINEERFNSVVFPMSVVSTGSPRLQYDIEYVFQVYGVLNVTSEDSVNSVECESEKSPPVTVLITNDSSSQCHHTALIASVTVLSICLILMIISWIPLVIRKALSKVPKERVIEPSIEIFYENVENSKLRQSIHNTIYEHREGIGTPEQYKIDNEIIYEPVRTDVVLKT